MKESKFKIGDKVVIKDYEFICDNRHISPANEKFQRHYNYMKGKEPLTINEIHPPNSMLYSEECDNLGMRGRPVENYQYNLYTPLSKCYLYGEEELELYESTDSE